MRTPNGEWTVEVFRTRGGERFRVRRRTIIGAHSGRGREPIGQVHFSVDDVSELLGPRFADLVEVAG
jgi:hypothetical protein